MKIRELKTVGFRNLADHTLTADPGINLLFGDNAQGKTNLMEALWLFTGNRSFRGAKESEMIAFDEKQARLSVRFDCGEREQVAELFLGGNKKGTINGVPLKSATELIGRYYAVVFSPADLSFLKDGPERRRRFLDAAISQLKPIYQKYLTQYHHVLFQRNTLLKDLYGHPELSGTLELWDQQLSKLGTILSSFRMDYIKKLNTFAKEVYRGISGATEEIDFCYRSTVFTEEEIRYTDETIARYQQALEENRAEDQQLGATGIGVHRDDIEVTINGINARVFGSQGQQRSCVLAMKLAESELLRAVTGESPVILLDDVMSELDLKRQDYILNHLDNQQVFITCCDPSNPLRLKSGSIFEIDSGRISCR